MNRAYFAGNYFLGNNGMGRSNQVRSLLPIPGVWKDVAICSQSSAKEFLFIDNLGNVFFLGFDSTGEAGQNTTIGSYYRSPIAIVRSGSYKDAKLGGSSGITSYFIEGSDGSIWSCGTATSGMLGNNTSSNISSPVSVLGGRSYSKLAIGSGTYHMSAIAGDGSVWAWGANASGALGNNSTTGTSSPVSIARPGSYRDVNLFGAGNAMMMIDALDGSVWVCGNASLGQLGNNTSGSSHKSSPVSIARPGSYSKIAGGVGHGFAIDGSDGSLWAWGLNTFGRLGNNSTTSTSSPVSIARPGSYTAISTINNFVYAIDGSDGSLWAWGANSGGQLCDGTSIGRSSPVSVLGNRSYTSVKVGGDYVAAMTADGTVYVAGYDILGLMGLDRQYTTTTIIPIINSSAFAKIHNNIFLDSSGSVYCTGPNGYGTVGDNTNNDTFLLVPIARSGSYKDVGSASGAAACYAIDGVDGSFWVWGNGSVGQLGNNTLSNFSSPVSIARPGSYSSMSCGHGFVSAIDGATGIVWVWGLNSSGQLGCNTTTATSSPVSIRRPGSYSKVFSGVSNSFFIDASNGSVWGTGSNTSGILGDNTLTGKSSPIPLSRPGSYSKVALSSSCSYFLDASDGSLWACGSNSLGQLGNGNTTSTSSPVSVLGGRSYTDIVVNNATLFALTSEGIVYALGDNLYGQFGDGTTTSSSSPVALPFSSVLAIHSTHSGNIILTIDATVPAVDTQPSNAVKVQGETAQFTVVAHGNPSL